MTARTARAPRFGATTLSTATWGMIFFILTEGILFSLLITTYFYLRDGAPEWPPAGIEKPALTGPIVNTVILLSSSIPMLFVPRAARDNQRGRLFALMLVSIVLGVIFLVIQGNELINLSFSAKDTAYGSLFYTLTGFHAAHLVAGILVLAYMVTRTVMSEPRRQRVAYENASYYWHFVDLVWVAVFLTLHISPHVIGKG